MVEKFVTVQLQGELFFFFFAILLSKHSQRNNNIKTVPQKLQSLPNHYAHSHNKTKPCVDKYVFCAFSAKTDSFAFTLADLHTEENVP